MTTSYNEPKIKDPYEFLGVKPTSSKYACKAAFKKLLKTYDIDIKRKASLAYDIICNKNKYILKNGYYEAVNKDHFYYTMIGDLKNLVKLYTKDKNILKEKDELGRNLLYIIYCGKKWLQ
jgi:curved DNA-binding protein CbpA